MPLAAAAPAAATIAPVAAASALEPSWWPTFVAGPLSNSRGLARFVNAVGVARRLDSAWGSVQAVYEDRLPLFAVAAGGRLRVSGAR
jgi:hypothetical protein